MIFPEVITVETVSECTLHCPYCAVHDVKAYRSRNYIEIDMFKNIMLQCRNYNPVIWLDFMGEPTLHPNFVDILDIINAENLKFSIETNATLWSDSLITKLANCNLERIIVTIEANAELFAKYRTSKAFDQVIAALKMFVERRKKSTPALELQVIVHPENLNFLNEIKKIQHDIKADKCFYKPIMVHQYSNNSDYRNKVFTTLWSEKMPSRYIKGMDGKIRLPDSAIKTPCPKLNEAVILSDGKMIMCCYDKGGKYVLGNLYDNSLIDLWEKSKTFREEVMKNRTTEFCHYCITDKIEDIFYAI